MFEGVKNIFMVGIEGSGMRGLAYLFAKQGFDVAGEDDTAAERREIDGYTIVPQADAAAAVRAADVLVYSDAVKGDHQLRILAEEQGIKQMPYQEALGVFAKQYTTLAVTGTHGKSSTTAMLAHILVEAGYDPTVLVGASLDVFGGRNARAGKGEYFVVEADEYRRHFLALEPTHIIITSIDFDHPDYFTSLEDVEAAYSE
ncbi:MAG TPA: Mur ligase family protein, partial [Methylophilaceae bacterium]|nr:Mur ligase family protein [Methylophilaceae bacterium]